MTYRVVQVTDDQLEATADGTGAVSVVSAAAFAGAPQAVAQVSKHTAAVRTWSSSPLLSYLVDPHVRDSTFSRLLSRTLSAMGAVLAGRLWAERHVSPISPRPPSAMEQPCRCRPPPTQRSHRQEVRKRPRPRSSVISGKTGRFCLQNERRNRISIKISDFSFLHMWASVDDLQNTCCMSCRPLTLGTFPGCLWGLESLENA